MKTFIIIPLALLSCASAAITTNKPYLLATVLFYNDGNGHQIIAAGHVPKKVRAMIRDDIKNRISSNTTVKIGPLFRHFEGSLIPSTAVIGFVKENFTHIYITELPKWLAAKVVYEKSKRMNLGNRKHDDLDGLNKDAKNSDAAVETNSISERKDDEIKQLSTPNTYYMPNTVFYAVETKCKTPKHYTCYLKNNNYHQKPVKNSMKSFQKTGPMSPFKNLFKLTKSWVSQFV